MKISVILNENESKRFDDYCHSQGHKKSTLIARLIREYLDRENFNMQQSLLQNSELKSDAK
jgi:metal-responsive CopG/Arc/MetJ family transcriptional regulator